jgi:hypothetical protein
MHTKRKNRLTTTRLNALVFIQFNLKMMNKRKNIKSKKITDVLISNETTEAQGFLFEGSDDYAEIVHRDDYYEVMPGTNICYSVIGESMGVDVQLQLHRSSRMRDLYIEEEFESEKDDFKKDEDFMAKIEGGRGGGEGGEA